MHAVTLDGAGGPEVLTWSEVPDPVAGPGEVVIEVAASGVNRADILQRMGFYPPPPGTPDWPGLECSGVISAIGAGVTSWAVGDEACALLSGGGYAQRVAVPVGQVMPIPSGVGLVDAAALPEVACTVWSNLILTASLREGDWLLVHGGGSGIGTFAIQFARAMGARVAVTAGSQAKLDRCEALGAEVLIHYGEQDFVEVVRRESGGRGADVILDNMGAAYLQRNIDALAFGGRLAIIGMQGGVRGDIDLGVLLRRNGTIHATSLRGRPAEQKSDICSAVVRQVWPLVDAGVISPVIDRSMPMQEAAEAHRLLESGAVVGKILLTA